jgi:hypothetical protein
MLIHPTLILAAAVQKVKTLYPLPAVVDVEAPAGRRRGKANNFARDNRLRPNLLYFRQPCSITRVHKKRSLLPDAIQILCSAVTPAEPPSRKGKKEGKPNVD